MLQSIAALGAPSAMLSAPRPTPALESRRRWEQRQHRQLALSDGAIIATATGAGLTAQMLGDSALAPQFPQAILLVLAWLTLLSGLHSRHNEVLGSGVTEYRRVAHASGLALGFFAACGVLLDWDGMRVMLFAVGPIGFCGLFFSRWLWRRWLHRQRLSGRFLCRTLVVGFEGDVRFVLASLNSGSKNGFHIVGATLFDGAHDSASTPLAARAGRDTVQVPSTGIDVGDHHILVFGCIDSVARTAARLGADRIIVASTPSERPKFLNHLSWELEGKASELILSHRITDVVGPRISFRPLDGLPLLQIAIPSYEGGKHLLKRVLDVTVATLALVPLAILAPVLALLIKFDSPGPLLYRQERLGRDGEQFRMLKFRTMRIGADAELASLQHLNEGAGPLFKLREDPRVTRVGRVLRRLSLDELPQFWNVLVGDMSVVGPRPPLPVEVLSYDGDATRRMYIKPGITGLWQVSGRSDLSWEDSVRLDLRYVENWSLTQDLQIMWRTARVMVRPSGAY